MRNVILAWITAVSWLVLAQAQAQEQQPQQIQEQSREQARLAERVEQPYISTDEYSFNDLTNGQQLELNGLAPQGTLDFGGRYDQVVTGATLDLRYDSSPTLNSGKAQLLIYVNDELAHVVALREADTAESVGSQRKQVNLPPHLFSLYNRLTFRLIDGEAMEECTSGLATSWLAIDSRSRLQLTTRKLPYANELAYFPEPWFDRNDFNPLDFTLLTPQQADFSTLEASAIVASKFAALADWRGIAINYQTFAADRSGDEWPASHSVVLLTDDEWPQDLYRENRRLIESLPDFAAPQVVMLTNPDYPSFKVLALRAATEESLITAAHAFTTLGSGLSGPYAELREVDLPEVAAYAAPRWISSDRKVMFSELVQNQQELQREGYQPDPVRISLRLPPDLFTWQNDAIPLDLKYRFTPPITTNENQLTVRVNDLFVKAFRLQDDEVIEEQRRVRIPLVDGAFFDDTQVNIPAFKLGLVNELQFEFDFSPPMTCLAKPLENSIGVIDGDSSIDLTGYQHYVAMPELSLFAKAGFPYTRYHDLSETMFILPDESNQHVIDLMLRVVAEFSRATGGVTTGLTVGTLDDYDPEVAQDIVLIGASTLNDWRRRFGTGTLQRQLDAQPLAGREVLLSNPQRYFETSGPSAAIVSFESPHAKTRTVTALTATSDEFLGRIDDVLADPELSNQVGGFLTLMTPVQVASFPANDRYYVGELSGLTYYAYHLSEFPLLVVLFAIIVLAIAAVLLRQVFGVMARRRIAGQKK